MAHPAGDSTCASWRISSRVIISEDLLMDPDESGNPGMMEQAFPELVLHGQFLLYVGARMTNGLAYLFRRTASQPRNLIDRETFQRVQDEGLAVQRAHLVQKDIELGHHLV